MGILSFYNSPAAVLWGRNPRIGDPSERYCGSLFLRRSDGTIIPHDQSPMALAIREGRAFRNEEATIERPDGSRVPLLVNVNPLRSPNGEILGAVNVFFDATEIKRAEDARDRLAAIVESSDDAIISKDLNGVIVSWNRGAERLFGYTASEAVGMSVTRLIPDDRWDEEPGILERVRRGERTDHYETIRRRKDGSLIDISLTVSPIINDRGQVIGASKIARDISERKHAAVRLALEQEATARFYEIGKNCVRNGSDIIENLKEMLDAAIWISHADRGCIQLHDPQSDVLRLTIQRGFEEPFRKFFETVTRTDMAASGIAFAQAERVIVEDVGRSEVYRDKPAGEILLEAGVRAVQSTPLIGSTGTVLGMLSTHYFQPFRPDERACRLLDILARQAADYVERKRVEEQREELLHAAESARAEAEAASRAKDEFLAMLGHELRNPLSAVRNSIAIAGLDEKNRDRALQIARGQTDQLGRIVDDLLDTARITRGRIRLRKERVRLGDVLSSAIDGARLLLDERGHALNTVSSETDILVEIDTGRIEQALWNLFSNAAKYTDPGGNITVTTESSDGWAVIRVSDNGIGIAAEVLPFVFDLFAQSPRALDRAPGGLGIGLTLVREILEIHGGRVEAKSAGLGQGSEFSLFLPLAADTAQCENESSVESVETFSPCFSMNILIVEDNPDAAESLAMILELLGHRVRAVHDGVAALKVVPSLRPDVMLIDIGLPGMDGYDVAKQVRAMPELSQTVMIALTGYGRPEDQSRALEAGFDRHLVKPVDFEALEALLSRIIHETPLQERKENMVNAVGEPA
jgi:PAS domain S-box-containing protein